jgi:hypothetical protein
MSSAREATAQLVQLLRREQSSMAAFLLALSDFDRGRRWLELGFSGLFPFLQRELGLSKASAYYRKTAAELVQEYPELEAPLRDGRLCLTALGQLARVITPENRAEVLPRFFHVSAREAEAVAAEISPQDAPPRRQVVTAVRAAVASSVLAAMAKSAASPTTASSTEAAGPGSARTAAEFGNSPQAGMKPAREPIQRQLETQEVENGTAERAVSSRVLPARTPLEARPLTADLRRLHVTVSRRFVDKLEAAAAALSHTHPGAGAEELLEAGLDLLLEHAARRRGEVPRPHARPRPTAPDRVTAQVKREVWARDKGRCQFPIEGGGVCGETRRLQVDHVRPRALGGDSTPANLRLVCGFHNIVAARRALGMPAWIGTP